MRRTRKNGLQRGGGVWFQVNNIGAVSAAIKSMGLTDILDTRQDLESRKKRVSAYVDAITNQDEIFTKFQDEYIKQFKPADAASAADWVIADKENIDKDIVLKSNIENLALGTLTLTKLSDINPSSKLALIKTGKYASASHIVLYPACLQNMVITGIARLFVALKSDPSALEAMVREPAGESRRRIMIEILASQNVSFIRSLALMMTQEDVRDGLTIMSASMNPTLLAEFWKQTLNTIILNYTADNSALFKTDAGYVIHGREDEQITDTTSIDEFGFVAGTLFIYYKNGRLADVFENFKKDNVLDDKQALYASIVKYAPPDDKTDNSYLNIPVAALGGATLGSLLTQMTMDQLHFILHLRHAIEREEAAASTTD